MPQDNRLITFLSDFGLSDGSVGVCHGVMQAVAPAARVIDIAHELSPFQVIGAAFLLRATIPYFEVGVHVAVIDPGVGTGRRAVAIRTGDGRTLVGPDNGLLMPVALDCGGIKQAVEISDSPYRNKPVSKTFHGRDIFCPVGAHLATGKSLDMVGIRLDPADLTELTLPEPIVKQGLITARALFVDRFGNVSLNIGRRHISDAGFSPGSQIELERGGELREVKWCETYDLAEAGEIILFEDSFGAVAIAAGQSSACKALGIEPLCEIDLKISRR